MRKNNIIIELTPLLDVILLILFFILVQSEGRIDIAYTEAREAFEAELEEFIYNLDEEVVDLRQTAIYFDTLRLGLEEDTSIIMLSLEANEIDRNIRSILIEAQGNTTAIGLSWDQLARDNALLALNTVLADHIQNAGSTVTFIVFRFDSANIFTSDYSLVGQAIHNQRTIHSQVFSAEMDLR
ncbi:MAG: hypothetical protein FWC91_12065 [Defluviitaleaceae bacterium]|nr:hypothetical protein [Defluviitaleaceae bacterium]